MNSIRLDRFLAGEGAGSRAEVKKMIRSGRVRVNGVTAASGDMKTAPASDEITVDGKPVRMTEVPTLMLNKPAGVVSATQDVHFRTVVDLIDEPWADKLFPVGRLDRDTEGLLLLTSDGRMSHELLSPKKHVAKIYFAVVSGCPDQETVRLFREGLDIGEKRRTLPAGLLFLGNTAAAFPAETWDEDKAGSSPVIWDMKEAAAAVSEADIRRCGGNECCVLISITEGKFHQIKRMFLAAGREVHFLKRIAMGGLYLDPSLPPGAYRALTREELAKLRGSRTIA